MLDDFDKQLEKRGLRFVMYADDFIVFVKSRRAGERVSASIRRFLDCRLQLAVNDEKSRVGPTDGTEFRGCVFKKCRVRWSDKAFSEFKRRVRELTGRSWGVSLDFRLKKLTLYVRGRMNYFGISEYYDPVSEIDMWLRRRVRACIWKQWKNPRTRIRELRKMGTSLKSAIFAGVASHIELDQFCSLI